MSDSLSQRKSCGAVVFHKFEGVCKVLLVNFLRGDLNYWGYAKGGIETGETETQTAKREIKEETGLDVKIIPGFSAHIEFIHDNLLRKVKYFAAESVKTEFAPQTEEDIKHSIDVKWCTFEEAMNLITFDDDKNVLAKFVEFYQRYETSKNGFDYTLNLPKTDFSMKANLPQKEPQILKKWQDENLYEKLLEKNKDKPMYLLHDGPPYANGDIHLGHALNKILKDIIVKYKNMNGFCAPFVPGWDGHGLPIELKARKKLNLNNCDEISDLELRKICKECALEYVDRQREQFKRLGAIGDWENPYITFAPKFVAEQIKVFAKMTEKGAIYRGLKPVHWCSTCKTALAEAEIEYKTDDCESIFVKFNVIDDKSLFKNVGADLQKTYFVIWTTTPWSLPGNVAVCLGSNFEYSLIKCGDEFLVIADKLKEKCMELLGNIGYQTVAKFKGSELENMKSAHPFFKRESLVILGSHVTLESGTGCVHTAPGHGIEDFEVCKKYNLPTIVPINDDGIFTSDAEMFAGMNLNEANKAIVKHLESSNLLFSKQCIKHQYPHCWRCKDPLLFRATRQWFCSIDSFKETALHAIDDVEWIPHWGKERIKSMVSDRSDWCISRQRKWGVPIPIFLCKNCEEPLIDSNVMKNVARIFRAEGADSWYSKNTEEFLGGEIMCKNCGHKKFSKENDIMDVWFDSGTTHEFVCSKKNGTKWPADLYLEGGDQFRGWFQSSLLTAAATKGGAPYKTVLATGWVVDEEGNKQSKSLGNVVDPSDVINKYGADILRLWVASSDYQCDMKVSYNLLKQISESYRKIRNTARFILGNLYDFVLNDELNDFENFQEIDKWILYRLKKLEDNVKLAYNSFEFHTVFNLIHKFCIIDLSNFYLDILKDRLYVYNSNDIERKTGQNAMFIILSSITKMLAPILSFTAEEIWSAIPHKTSENAESIFLNNMFEKIGVNSNQDFLMKWDNIYKFSGEIKKILEIYRKNKVVGSSLEAEVIVYCSDEGSLKMLNDLKDDLRDVLKISKLIVKNNDFGEQKCEKISNVSITVKKSEHKKCERCWNFSENIGKNADYPVLCDRCIKILDL